MPTLRGWAALGAAFALAVLWIGFGERLLLAAALFAVHPVRAESVTFISGRVDVLAGAFYVATLLVEEILEVVSRHRSHRLGRYGRRPR